MKAWFEELPDQCPPEEAYSPQGMTVYRFSFTELPTNNDFLSHRLLYPDGIFGVSECRARSLSVFDNLDTCKNMHKLPRFRRRFKSILKLDLREDDGLIMKTSTNPYHYSWWRSISFNVELVTKI